MNHEGALLVRSGKPALVVSGARPYTIEQNRLSLAMGRNEDGMLKSEPIMLRFCATPPLISSHLFSFARI